jgi:uncharacterized protein (TIGR02996 family)
MSGRHEEFYQAIRAHPEEDAPRLIYADWLEEQGETDRAEFIRAHCQMAVLAKDDPQRHGVSRVCAKLLAQHPEWQVESTSRFHAVFHRGFVEDVEADLESFLGHGAAITQHAPLLRLRVIAEELDRFQIHSLAASPYLADVHTLDLSRIRFLDRGLEVLLRSPHVKGLLGLRLQSCGLRNADAKLLAAAQHLAGLQLLDVENNRITDLGAVPLAHSPHLAGLRKLDLRGNNLGPEGRDELSKRFGDRVLFDPGT